MARRTPPPSYTQRLAQLARSGLGRVLLSSLLAAVLVWGLGAVVKQARAYAHGLEAYRLGPSAIRFVDLPERLGPLVVSGLRDPRAIAFDVSVFDARAEERIRSAVAAHPMVECVRSVEIVYPCRADVRVVLRRPAAWFLGRWPDGRRGWLLVSSDQHRLDERLYRHYLRRLPVPLPKVEGVRAYAPTHAGQRWEDQVEQVAEGLAAAAVARRLYRDLGGRILVETIDVAFFPAEPEVRRAGEVRLELQDERTIEWGRTERDLDGVAGEDGYAVKRARLEAQLMRARPHAPPRIDVRYRLAGEGQLAGPGR